ncbi:MAG: hypothetical protein PVJ67_04495 [Candidatus Pacearchaeota archaeon]|jgi:hypothetical protein
MTNPKIAKEIYNRLEGRKIPEDPVEFQRLALGSKRIRKLDNLTGKINDKASAGYRELDFLLEDYCSSCNLEENCDWNKQVRMAAGENYPFWLKNWPVVEFPLYSDEPYFMNGKTVMCTHYQSDKLNQESVEISEQPLLKLTEIIEEKQKNLKKA